MRRRGFPLRVLSRNFKKFSNSKVCRMPELTSAVYPHARSARRKRVSAEVKTLHRRCGVYTKAEVVCRILDAIGWRREIDLSQSCLLEPAAGDGAFVVEAARRLVASF